MNAVIGLSRILMDTDLSSEQHHYLNLINDSGRLLVTIINVLLFPHALSSLLVSFLLTSSSPFCRMCWTLAESKVEGSSSKTAPTP